MANEVESLESLEKVWDVCKSQDDKKHELISVRLGIGICKDSC